MSLVRTSFARTQDRGTNQPRFRTGLGADARMGPGPRFRNCGRDSSGELSFHGKSIPWNVAGIRPAGSAPELPFQEATRS